MKRHLRVNGFDSEVCYPDHMIETVFRPLLRDLNDLRTRSGKRQIVLMAGPPAAGKSTLALFLEKLSEEEGLAPLQALGMDGFHYPNAYLQAHSTERDGKRILLSQIKGSPETYDTSGMETMLSQIRNDFLEGCSCQVRWPAYDRNLHDVVPGKFPISGEILLIEGNYFLLKEPAWERIRSFADATIMIRSREDALRERLISRKMRGGMDRDAAAAWYEQTDARNIETVLSKSVKADHEIYLEESQGRCL